MTDLITCKSLLPLSRAVGPAPSGFPELEYELYLTLMVVDRKQIKSQETIEDSDIDEDDDK